MRDTTRDLVLRVLLAVLALGTAVVGFWAQFSPESFYDDFPVSGGRWIGVDGPYNEHLIRDVGGLNLALTVVLVAAIVTLSAVAVRVAALAFLVYALPHFVYHLHHLDGYDTIDQIGMAGSLGAMVVIPVVLLAMTWPRSIPVDEVDARR